MALSIFLVFSLSSRSSDSATDLLKRAEYYADLYNWRAAAPLFAHAEQIFHAGNDRRNESYAHIGVLRASNASPIPERSQYLADHLIDDALFRSDLQLRLFALRVKGELDGEFDQAAAREDWKEVLALAHQIGEDKWTYRAEGQLGFCDYYDGDLASTRRKVAGALIRATKANDIGAQIFFLSTTAIGLAMQNLLQPEGIQYAQAALNLAKANPDSGQPEIAFQAMVMLLVQTGRPNEAKQLAQQLLSRPGDDVDKVNHFQSAAYVASAQKEYRLATTYFEQALASATVTGSPRVISEIETGLAQMYLSQGNIPRAEVLARDAITRLEHDHVVTLLPAKLDGLAQVLSAEQKFGEARSTYEQAETLQDILIGRADSLTVKTALITGADQLYEHHVALLADHFHDPDAAFAAVEQARGRAVVDLLTSSGRTSQASKETERTISRLRLQISSLKSTEEIRHVRQEIFMAEQGLAVNPDLTILSQATKQFKPLSIEQVQRVLRTEEVLVEYVTTEPHSYALVITGKSKQIVPLASRTQLEKVVHAYFDVLRKHQNPADMAQQLYSFLIDPVLNVSHNDHLIIVPDGILNLVPFDALVNNRGEYLVRSHVIVYEPSSTSLYLLRTKPLIREADSILTVGGVPYQHSGVREEVLKRGYGTGSDLDDLPNSEPEAMTAADALPMAGKRNISGFAATETAVKTALNHRFTYVHLAVHAFSSTDPTRSSLVLLSDPHNSEDGFLQASEILQYKIPAKLVVLSACDTASGPIQGQEGVSALSTAFLLAGSRSVVSTLWPVEDQASLALMRAFYRHLQAERNPEDSLAAAKRDILSRLGPKSDPSYWAGFIVQGSQPYLAPKDSQVH
jgi:CHAT domain-containing protein/tetratricopeptide (TPR) repeat protein